MINDLFRAFDRTDEQSIIVDAALNRVAGVPIIIDAGAGTGKTSILVDVARESYRHGDKVLYLVFNKHTAEEGERRLNGYSAVATFGSMAFKNVGSGREVGTIKLKSVVQFLGLKGGSQFIEARTVLNCIKRYCETSDNNLSVKHLSSKIRHNRERIVSMAADVFDAIREGKGDFTLPYDVMIKIWALNGAPGLGAYDLVLVDEGQDLSPVLIDIVIQAKNAVLVGDDGQCIYGFKGADNGLAQIDGRRFTLSQSFRFGPDIAELANKILSSRKNMKPKVLVRGNESLSTRIGKVSKGLRHTRVYRYNRDLLYSARFLADQDLPVSILGDMSELATKIEDCWKLKNGITDRRGVGRYFRDWNDLLDAHESGKANDLGQVIQIIEEHDKRTPELISLLRRDWSETDGKVSLVTGHRCKGLEFNDVIIHEDFDEALNKKLSDDAWNQEMNLLYVACTRAMRTLEVRPEFLQRLL